MTPFVLVTGDFVTTGGMDRANYALAWSLANRGHPVHLVTHRAADALTRLPEVQTHLVRRPFRSAFLGAPLLNQVGRSWARALAPQGGRVVVNGGNCQFGDVNWVHYVHAEFSTRRDGSWPTRLRRRLYDRVSRRAETRSLAQARVVIANSQTTRLGLLKHFGLDPQKVCVIYYGVDATLFRPVEPERRTQLRARLGWKDARPVVAFVGALGDHRKGFDTVFAAWQNLCRSADWDVDLAVVGTGAALPHWQAKSVASGLAERIRFLGFRADVPEVLAACDALVAPARYEAYGLNVHEALCCGLPAFVSSRAGVAERYPAELQGLLLPDPDDDVDLANRLRAWRSDPQRCRVPLEQLSRTLRNHDWETMATAIREHVLNAD